MSCTWVRSLRSGVPRWDSNHDHLYFPYTLFISDKRGHFEEKKLFCLFLQHPFWKTACQCSCLIELQRVVWGWTKNNWLEQESNLRSLDWRAGAPATELSCLMLAVSLLCHIICSGVPSVRRPLKRIDEVLREHYCTRSIFEPCLCCNEVQLHQWRCELFPCQDLALKRKYNLRINGNAICRLLSEKSSQMEYKVNNEEEFNWE